MTIQQIEPELDLTLPFTRAAAVEAGLTPWRLRSLLTSRAIRRVLTGVYVSSNVSDSLELRARAAALVVPPHAVVVDESASWLWGVDAFRYGELDFVPPLRVFVLRGHARVTRRGCAGGERDLGEHDVTEVLGVKVTTPLRTCLDLACKLRRYDALAVVDAYMRDYRIDRRALLASVPRYRRRRGVVQLRELVTLGDPRAESPRESWVRLAIVDAHLPVPQPQFWVTEHGVRLYRLDFAYPRARIAVEYDGELHHDQSAEQRARDETRRQWLRERGWKVIVVAKAGFTDEGRPLWLDELRSALWAAGWRP